MRIIRFLNHKLEAGALAIGNFDGVHCGHQALLARLVQEARRLNVPATVMTFEPLPREFFSRDKQQDIPARLTRLREKVLEFKRHHVDCVLVVRFDQLFSSLNKKTFIEHLLVKQLNARCVIVGQDFHFGVRRAGNFTYLNDMGSCFGFEVIAMPELNQDNKRVSSTWVRDCLQQDNLVKAEQLLGRPYSMLGRVGYGEKLGRRLGFPTANIYLHRVKTPVHGIYAVKIHGLADQPLLGVANVGERPAVGGSRTLLEVFIFNFSQEIYGREVEVSFLHKLRNEAHYDSLDALKVQIAKDVEAAKSFFAGVGG